MGCGRVPVVSNLDQFKDYVHNGDNGVIFDHKAADPVASLVAALRSLITDPARLEHMSHTAAATACDYSFSHIADLYLADFYAMLNTRDA
jgi:glycosyltransferase involved in cell wall biosynthesis